jgi:large subunit ribosomal protein L4
MSAVKVVSPAGKAGANVQLPDEIFGPKVNAPLIHQVVVAQEAAAAAARTPSSARRGARRRAQTGRKGPAGRGADPGAAGAGGAWCLAVPLLRAADAEEMKAPRLARAVRPGRTRPGARGQRLHHRRRAAGQRTPRRW